MKKKLFALSIVFALAVSLLPAVGAKAAAASMSSTGDANLKVIDVSHYDVPTSSNGSYLYSDLNWTKIKANVDAIYIKATEGHSYTDPTFSSLANSAQSAGVSHGFYHFFWPNSDTSVDKQQADYFYDTIKSYPYNCIPVLDVEETNSSSDMAPLSAAQITSAVEAFADEFKAESGRDIMIYTYNSFVNDYFTSALSKYKLWIANYNSSVSDTNVWHKWDMWQYTSGLSVAGMPSAVDGDWATDNIFLASSPGITLLDNPSGTYGTGAIPVSGWAISFYGVTRVDIYVDGKFSGSVPQADFTQRPDIETKFGGSGYDDALDSGFSYEIPADTLGAGSHTVTAAALDSDGNAVWSAAKQITVNAPVPQICLDNPTAGTYGGDVAVSGWAISRFGIMRVDVYVDGKPTASVMNSAMTDRPDIESIFGDKGYDDLAHSGYAYTIPGASLTAGNHTVQTVLIDNKGNKVWSATSNITVKVPAPQICLDKPASGTYSGALAVSGWAASHFGVMRVDVYVDGKFTASVPNSAMTERTDVESVYADKGFEDLAHSGYASTVDGLSEGSHTVRTVEIDNKGNKVWSPEKTVKIEIPSDRIFLESPAAGTYSGAVTVKGWAVSYYGVKRVDIYIDGKPFESVMNASMTDRPDVERAYSGEGYTDFDHSGFSYTIPSGELARGSHTVQVVQIDGSGKTLWSGKTAFTLE